MKIATEGNPSPSLVGHPGPANATGEVPDAPPRPANAPGPGKRGRGPDLKPSRLHTAGQAAKKADKAAAKAFATMQERNASPADRPHVPGEYTLAANRARRASCSKEKAEAQHAADVAQRHEAMLAAESAAGAVPCVRHRDGWCALHPDFVTNEGDNNAPTLCEHVVTLPSGYDVRLPDCPECLSRLRPKAQPVTHETRPRRRGECQIINPMRIAASETPTPREDRVDPWDMHEKYKPDCMALAKGRAGRPAEEEEG